MNGRKMRDCLQARPERPCKSSLCSCIALFFDALEMPLPTRAPQSLQRGQQS
jgi:hypothetical protein